MLMFFKLKLRNALLRELRYCFASAVVSFSPSQVKLIETLDFDDDLKHIGRRFTRLI